MTISEEYRKVIRVFIASPSDLNAERKNFNGAIRRVNRIKANAKGIQLEAVGWEDTLPGKGRPQEKINEDVRRSHLVVMLLWKRWGSPTGKYSSGFEEEYEVACEDNKETFLYFRDITDDMLADPGEQLKKVLKFRNKVESERKFLFRRYEDENTWEDQFIFDLCRWLDGLPPATVESLLPTPATFESKKLTEYEKRIEQLERELGKIRIEQIRVAYTLAKEAQEQADSGHTTKAEEYFAKAIAIYPEINTINDYGLFLIRIGALKKAEHIFIQMMQMSKIIGDEATYANAYGNLGNIYRTRGNLDAAEEMYKESLSIDEKLGRKEGMANTYGNLGMVYKIRGDLKAAEEMYKMSLSIDEKLGRKEGMAIAYNNLGILYNTRGDRKSAEEMYKKSLFISKKLERKEGMADAYGNLGNPICHPWGPQYSGGDVQKVPCYQ
jgi:Tetratricopeptide repeat.